MVLWGYVVPTVYVAAFACYGEEVVEVAGRQGAMGADLKEIHQELI